MYQCYCKSTSTFFSYEEICDNYHASYQVGIVLSNVVSYGIVIFNIIIREANMFLIKKIGYHTESE